MPVTPPNLLTDPGVLYYAILGSTVPTNTVVGSVFTDSWPVAWKSPGMTADGTEFHPSTTVAPINAAEQIDPIAYRTTDRATTIQLTLLNATATQLAQALNGATTTVTGTTTTTLTKVTPVQPGSEIRYMWGWESVDHTVRWVAYQTINSGDLAIMMKKAPSAASYALTLNCEVPIATGTPWEWWFAGTARG